MESQVIDRREHPPGAVFFSWKTPDGWLLRRMDWPQPKGVQPRGSLLFLGGRGDFVEKYIEPMAHWHGCGWNVASFDWRGQGGSCGSIVGGNVDSFDPFIDDLDALLEEWRVGSLSPHVAVAHSMGAHLLLRLLVERQAKLDAVVLVAPMIAVNAAPLPQRLAGMVVRITCRLGFSNGRVWRQPEGQPEAQSRRRLFLTSCPDRYQDELWWRARHPNFSLGPPSWGWLKAAYASARSFTPQRLGQVNIPLLILAAKQDRLVSSAAIKQAAKAMPAARLHFYHRAAHELLRESDPVRLDALARIDRFLQEQVAQ
jgi:lysophospholipase